MLENTHELNPSPELLMCTHLFELALGDLLADFTSEVKVTAHEILEARAGPVDRVDTLDAQIEHQFAYNLV